MGARKIAFDKGEYVVAIGVTPPFSLLCDDNEYSWNGDVAYETFRHAADTRALKVIIEA
jgi:hypothetical protein